MPLWVTVRFKGTPESCAQLPQLQTFPGSDTEVTQEPPCGGDALPNKQRSLGCWHQGAKCLFSVNTCSLCSSSFW